MDPTGDGRGPQAPVARPHAPKGVHLQGQRRRGRGVWALAAGATAVIVAVASLAVLGDLPGIGKTPNVSSPFALARSAAEGAARTYGSADLSVRWAVGFSASGSFSLPDNFTYFPVRGPACDFTPIVVADHNLTTATNVSNGASSDWTFVFANNSNRFLVVVVSGGSAHLAGSFSGVGCPYAYPQYGAVPDGVVDPEVASGTAARSGGFAFLAHHAAANVTLAVDTPLLGSLWIGPHWSVVYSDCPPAAPSVRSGAFFEAVVNGTSGALESAQNYSAPCPLLDQVVTTPLNDVLAVTSAFESSAGGSNWYNFTVRVITAPVAIGSLGLVVQDALGTNLTLPNAGLTVVSSGGSPLAQYDLTNGTWASGASSALGVGDRFILRTTGSISGQGDWLQLLGHGYYDGTVSLSIP